MIPRRRGTIHWSRAQGSIGKLVHDRARWLDGASMKVALSETGSIVVTSGQLALSVVVSSLRTACRLCACYMCIFCGHRIGGGIHASFGMMYREPIGSVSGESESSCCVSAHVLPWHGEAASACTPPGAFNVNVNNAAHYTTSFCLNVFCMMACVRASRWCLGQIVHGWHRHPALSVAFGTLPEKEDVFDRYVNPLTCCSAVAHTS